MNRKDSLIVALSMATVVLLFTTVIQYYNTQLAQKEAEKAELEQQISRMQKPDLVTALGIQEIISSYTYNENDPATYNHILIEGTVTNMGLGTAIRAGLHVEVIDLLGNVVVNTTVPIAAGSYGLGGNLGPIELFDLPSKAQGTAQIAIYHKGVASTWNVTPVCDNQ